MRSKPRLHNDVSQEKEQRIVRFIRQNISLGAEGDGRPVLLVSRSMGSPVARALNAIAAELAPHSIDARIVLACEECSVEPWPVAASSLVREVRIVRNPRMLDAHEQLVLGACAVWYGDSLRRDPLKRDAYENFRPDDAGAARVARNTFEKFWQATEPLYVHNPAPAAGAPYASLHG